MSDIDASSFGPPEPQAPQPPATEPQALQPLPPRRSHARIIATVAAIAAGVLVLLGVGAWAVYAKFLGSDGGAADSAQALPASTLMMFELSIEPSTQQKLLLAKMGDRMDGVQKYLDSAKIDVSLDKKHSTELRPAIWNALVDKLDINTDLDYDKDLAPWLGGRIAVGMVGGTDDPAESWIIAIESKDDKAGVDATETFLDDAFDHGTRNVQVEARHGYVIIAPESLDLDEAYQDGVLASQPAFKSTVGGLGSRGLASFWMGTYAYTDAMSGWARAYDRDTSRVLTDALDDIPEGAGQAMVIRAFDGGLEGVGVTSGARGPSSSKIVGDAGAQIAALPDTTAAALSLEQFGTVLDTMFTREYLASSGALSTAGDFGGAASLVGAISGGDNARASYDDIVSAWTDDIRVNIEDTLGLDIPDEANVAFGSGVVAAVDRDLNCTFDDGTCDEPRVALVVYSRDINATTDAMDSLLKDAGISSRDLDYTVANDDSRLVLGLGDYVDELTENAPRSLGGLPEFRKALPDAGSATFAMYASVDGILHIATDNGADLDSKVKNAIGDFAAVGVSATMHPDGTTLARYRIVLAD